MVAIGDGEWYAAVDQRLQERTDATRTLARVRSILPRRAGSHCRLRNVSRYASSYPAIWLPFENNKIGACGVKRGLDEADGCLC